MAQWGFELEDDGSHILSLKISPPRLEAECGLSSDIAREAFLQLAAYFGGRLKNFSLPIRMVGTDFQMSVWKALRTVPFGETVSYSRLAAMASRQKACRAAAAACGANPIPIIVPCHRVIAADGSIGGFSSGLRLKRFLLGIEAGR